MPRESRTAEEGAARARPGAGEKDEVNDMMETTLSYEQNRTPTTAPTTRCSGPARAHTARETCICARTRSGPTASASPAPAPPPRAWAWPR